MARITGSYSSNSGTFGGGEGISAAFDNNTGTKMCNTAWNSSFYFQVDAGALYVLNNTYRIASGNDSPERDPRNWTIQGSPDGSNWTVLDTVSGQGSWGSRQSYLTFTLDQNPSAYRYFRMYVSANQSSGIMQLSELELTGELARLITLTKNGNGTVSPGTQYVQNGASPVYTITPDAGWVIKEITVDGTPQTITNKNGMNLTISSVTANKALVVTFAKKGSGFLLFM